MPKPKSLLFSFLFLAFLVLSVIPGFSYAQALTNISTVDKVYANKTIAEAQQYIEKINESTYLIFAPNLTQAYEYLSKAEKAYNTSPEEAVLYAKEAMRAAAASYDKLNAYRLYSALVMFAVTVALALLLLHIMRKVPKEGRNRKGSQRIQHMHKT
jgi:hypothetical protein